MRVPRLFVDDALKAGDSLTLKPDSAHYLLRVLRVGVGGELVLFNGDGWDYRCRLTGTGRGGAVVEVQGRRENPSESPCRITLSQALSRGERMDYCLQKATELGVAAVQLLWCERVELKLEGSRLEKRLAHWRKVMQSASEQCGRARVPELRAPLELSRWAPSARPGLVLDVDSDQTLAQFPVGEAADIAVGPEGGFTPMELDLLKGKGVVAVRLGPRILRTETAGPAAIAVLQSMAGDFR